MLSGRILGRMYKPKYIKKIKSGGYEISCIYRSNFGKKNEFKLIIKLEYDLNSNKEYLNVIIKDLDLQVALLQDKFIFEESMGMNLPKFNQLINPLYKSKPNNEGYIKSSGILDMKFTIENINSYQIVDNALIIVYPVVIKDIEYMFVDIKTIFPVKVKNENGNIYIIKKEEEIYLEKKL